MCVESCLKRNTYEMICSSNLPPRSPRCSPHHSNPGRKRCVQLPGGLPRGHPRAVRLAVGEEGRRNGTTANTPLLQYNAAHLSCVCFCSVKVGSSPRRAPQNVKYISCLCRLDTSYCPVLVVAGAAGRGSAPPPPPRDTPAHAFYVNASSAYRLLLDSSPTDRTTNHSDKGLQSESERAADPR